MNESLSGFNPVEIERAHAEALVLNEAIDAKLITAEDVREKLTQNEMDPQRFLELIKNDTRVEALFYVLSSPGTTAHFQGDKRHLENFEKTKKAILEGGFLPENDVTPFVDRFGTATSLGNEEKFYEPHLSLSITLPEGISTAWRSDWNPKSGYINKGFILKPSFFMDKVAVNTSEEITQLLESMAEDDPNRIYIDQLMRSYNIKQSILGLGEPLLTHWQIYDLKENGKISEDEIRELYSRAMVVDEDYGVRPIKIENGEIVDVPITKDDVAYFSETKFVDLPHGEKYGKHNSDFQRTADLFTPDGELLDDSQWQEFETAAREFSVYEKMQNFYSPDWVKPTSE